MGRSLSCPANSVPIGYTSTARLKSIAIGPVSGFWHMPARRPALLAVGRDHFEDWICEGEHPGAEHRPAGGADGEPGSK